MIFWGRCGFTASAQYFLVMIDFFLSFFDKLILIINRVPVRFQSVYFSIAGYVSPLLSFFIIIGCCITLFRAYSEPERWGSLTISGNIVYSLNHWENIIGRAKACDIQIKIPTVSRTHAALLRDSTGVWTVYDLKSKTGVKINGKTISERAVIKPGEILTVGGLDMVFMPLTVEEEQKQAKRRTPVGRGARHFIGMLFLTLLQLMLCFSHMLAIPGASNVRIPIAFSGLIFLSWLAWGITGLIHSRGFEIELMGLLLTSIGFSVCASSAPESLYRQVLFFAGGLILFFILGWFLRDLNRIRHTRIIAAILGLALLAVNLIISDSIFGAKNWLSIGGVSFQPSEFVKIIFIFVSSVSMDRIFEKRSLILYIAFSAVCALALAAMSDFGTALVYFVTYLVIAYLRSGSIGTVFLSLGGTGLAGLLAIAAKPYVAERFAGWRHAWDNPYGSGYQQVRAMSAAAEGGLFGCGPGFGWLQEIVAANTDLVFGMLCEEHGLLMAVLCISCFFVFAGSAFHFAKSARSSFYTIAAAGTAALFLFQTGLNVLGSMDILPFTGVTFPFISRGGSSLVACWGLLAFIKASDTRANASFILKEASIKRRRNHESNC